VTIEENRKLLDLSRLELAIIVPLLLLIVLMGVYPKPFIDRIAASAEILTEQIILLAEDEAAGGTAGTMAVGEASASSPGTQ
jgi:NADH:ubiquinone oxidoreductase subunit 4 (subunit M)